VILFDVVLPRLKKKKLQQQQLEQLDQQTGLAPDEVGETFDVPPPAPVPTPMRRPPERKPPTRRQVSQPSHGPQGTRYRPPQPAPSAASSGVMTSQEEQHWEDQRAARLAVQQESLEARRLKEVQLGLRHMAVSLLDPLKQSDSWNNVARTGPAAQKFVSAIRSGDFPLNLPDAVDALGRALLQEIPELREQITHVILGSIRNKSIESIEDLTGSPAILSVGWSESVFLDALGLALLGPLHARARLAQALRRGKARAPVRFQIASDSTLVIPQPLDVQLATLEAGLLRMSYLGWSSWHMRQASQVLEPVERIPFELVIGRQVLPFDVCKADLFSHSVARLEAILGCRLFSLQGISLLELAAHQGRSKRVIEGLELSKEVHRVAIGSKPDFAQFVAACRLALDSPAGTLAGVLPSLVQTQAAETRALPIALFGADMPTAIAEGIVLGELLRRPGTRHL